MLGQAQPQATACQRQRSSPKCNFRPPQSKNWCTINKRSTGFTRLANDESSARGAKRLASPTIRPNGVQLLKPLCVWAVPSQVMKSSRLMQPKIVEQKLLACDCTQIKKKRLPYKLTCTLVISTRRKKAHKEHCTLRLAPPHSITLGKCTGARRYGAEDTTGSPNHSTAQSYGMCFNMIYSNSEVCVCVSARACITHTLMYLWILMDASILASLHLYLHPRRHVTPHLSATDSHYKQIMISCVIVYLICLKKQLQLSVHIVLLIREMN